MNQRDIATYEDWKHNAQGYGLEVLESGDGHRFTASHPVHVNRGTVRVVRTFDEIDPTVETGMQYWAATRNTPWEQVNENGIKHVLALLAQ